MKRILIASLLFAALGVQAQTTDQPTVATKAQVQKATPEERADFDHPGNGERARPHP
ncbi:MAG: hypothetical protein IPO05_11150 [Flavobacteriales bacterium]|nr:hypothetical protein [Flavobacteriales bacterium]